MNHPERAGDGANAGSAAAGARAVAAGTGSARPADGSLTAADTASAARARWIAKPVRPPAATQITPGSASAMRGPNASAAHPASGAPIGVVPRNTMPNSAMTRPRMAGVACACSSEFDVEMNTVLAMPTGTIASSAQGYVGMRASKTTPAPNAAAPAVIKRSPTEPRNAMTSPPPTAPSPMAENSAPYPPGP